MFCQNCGKEVSNKDTFCAFCGAKVPINNDSLNEQPNYNTNYNSNINNGTNTYSSQFTNNQQMAYNSKFTDFKETVFGKLLLNYFKKPLSIYSLMKDEDTLKVSVGMAIAMPIIYGFFHMLYFVSFFKNLINNLGYYANSIFVKLVSGFGDTYGVEYGSTDLLQFSDEISEIKDMLKQYLFMNIPKGDYFFKGVVVMFLMMAVAFAIIEICNATILRNSISHKNILLIVTVAYIPLVISIIISNIIIYSSIVATLLILVLGVIMSLISLFSGVLELNEESNDKTYLTIFINNVVFVIVVPFLMKIGMSSVFETIKNTLKIIDKL